MAVIYNYTKLKHYLVIIHSRILIFKPGCLVLLLLCKFNTKSNIEINYKNVNIFFKPFKKHMNKTAHFLTVLKVSASQQVLISAGIDRAFRHDFAWQHNIFYWALTFCFCSCPLANKCINYKRRCRLRFYRMTLAVYFYFIS